MQHTTSWHGDHDAYFTQFLDRTRRMIGPEAVAELRRKRVAISGCGGVGGAAAITFARMGIGAFTLADPGIFDEPDANRQWGASTQTLGSKKARVYEHLITAINPGAEVRVFEEGVTEENTERFLDDADVLIDCMDVAVAPALRAQLYESARQRGIYSAVAPILGFGTIVAASHSGGVPLEAFGKLMTDAVASSILPPKLWELFVPEHLVALAKSLQELKAPSVAPAPTLAAAIVCTETALSLVSDRVAGWRPPVTLPHLIAVDLFGLKFQVVHIDDLKPPPQEEALPQNEHARRGEILQRVGSNTNLIPGLAVDLDLMTDSWYEIPARKRAPSMGTDVPSVEESLGRIYGYEMSVPVHRGRLAEALLAKAVVKPGTAIAVGALFPTTRFHLETNGARLVEVTSRHAYDPTSSHPFKGDLDLDALRASEVQAVYLELASNAIGGHPVSLANLVAVREITAERGIPLILDATRAFANAQLIARREDGLHGIPIPEIVRRITALSDACAASLCKEHLSSVGGFIGTDNEEVFVAVRDLALLAYGDGLKTEHRETLARGLNGGAADLTARRTGDVSVLWHDLHAAGVPVLTPGGAHAIYVDAAALLPHIPENGHAAHALTRTLYAEAGIRAGVNMGTPAQRGQQLVRLAVPVGRYDPSQLTPVVEALTAIAAEPRKVHGLRQVGGPAGYLGEFAAQFEERE